MSITDELRKWAARELASWKMARERYDALTAIADRIDAEHEEALLNVHTDLMDASGWVRLPKDADGEYIRIGDEVETTNFGTVEVEGFVHRAVAFYNYSEQPAYLCTTPANLCHHHAPTVEDVLLEACKAYHGLMVEGMSDFAHDMPAPSEIIAEYAAKLRLAGDAE